MSDIWVMNILRRVLPMWMIVMTLRCISTVLLCSIHCRLRQTVKHAVEAGRLIPAVADEWVSGLQALSQSGGFLCTLTAYTVVGRKPAR